MPQRRPARAARAGSPRRAERPLVARTVAIDDPGPLLSLLPRLEDPAGICAWVRRGEGMVGWGRALSFDCAGSDRFERAERWWRDTVDHAVVRDDVLLPGTGPVAFGSLSFSGESPSGATLVVPEVVVGRRGDQWWVSTFSTGSLLPATVQPAQGPAPERPETVVFADAPQASRPWTGSVAEAVGRIGAGELDKVVLARSVQASARSGIDPRWLLAQLAQGYDNTWVFAVDGLVGATPERLVRLEKGLITSRVLAGTIQRTGDDARDLALAASLARSSKDLEEHEYAVRSVAQALAPHCSSMNVPEAPFVLHLANVMHLATDVAGVLSDSASSLRLAASLHPSAAVCGTPTDRAFAAIAELEGMDRGRYAGPVGWLDAAGDGDWAIALRCGAYDRADPRRLELFAGCGIVAGSDPAMELAESEAKLIPMKCALTG